MTRTPFRPFSLTLIAVAALAAGCSSVPTDNALLEQARGEYRVAQTSPATRELAPVELQQAGDALTRANDALARKAKAAEVEHLAYLARQRIAIAQETARQKLAERQLAQADDQRNKQRLDARTNEADAAQRSADTAQRSADASQRQAAASQQQAASAQQQAVVSQQQASAAQDRNQQLEAQLKDLNAKQTERGMVVTIGDVLFETDQARLRQDGLRNVDKLVGFLAQHPQRKALVEGYTDSTGSDSHNLSLSGRRAEAVRTALVDKGVGRERIATRGYGESHPVADNDSASGRQMNRRVEIVLSEDGGTIAPR